MGERVLETNNLLGPAELGLLATVGLQRVRVYDKPCVAVLSTGNEVSWHRSICKAGTVLSFKLMPLDVPTTDNGKIRDSNKIMLMSALQELNIPSVVDGGTAKDESVIERRSRLDEQRSQCCHSSESSVVQTLQSAFERADIVISTGGVSMGDKVSETNEKSIDQCITH